MRFVLFIETEYISVGSLLENPPEILTRLLIQGSFAIYHLLSSRLNISKGGRWSVGKRRRKSSFLCPVRHRLAQDNDPLSFITSLWTETDVPAAAGARQAESAAGAVCIGLAVGQLLARGVGSAERVDLAFFDKGVETGTVTGAGWELGTFACLAFRLEADPVAAGSAALDLDGGSECSGRLRSAGRRGVE